jgi:predicted enzyme related to lactoylglutathione lyase
MSKVTKYPPGTFCWVDLTTKDMEAAKKFYSGLFGWEFADMSAGALVYAMAQLGGENVAGMGEPGPDMPDAATSWNSYVSVEDVDTSVEQVKELGGKVLHEPGDIGEAGRTALIAGPEGAPLWLWQANRHAGAGLVNEPGTFVWNELMAPSADESVDFYTKLFGWAHKVQEMPDGRVYHIFENKGRPAAALLEMTKDMADMPAMWAIYLAVADLDASLAKVKELGGKVEFGPMTIPKTGSFAMVGDTMGGHFYLIQMEQEPTPL